MRMLNVYNAGADADPNANYNPLINSDPDPT